MARKRYDLRHGEGSFYQRKSDGVWVGVLEVGWTAEGKRRRATVTSRDKDKAWDKLTALRKRQALGQHVVTSSPTMKTWAEQWLELRSNHLAPSTLPQYRSRVRRWIIPELGRLRVDAVRPAHVRALWQTMRSEGRAETEAALRERDEAIVEALDNGARIIEVQFATGISGARVSQIRSKHLRERS